MENTKQLLNKAIALHQTHMEKPDTATAKSQEKLMELIKAARAALSCKVHKPMPMGYGGKSH